MIYIRIHHVTVNCGWLQGSNEVLGTTSVLTWKDCIHPSRESWSGLGTLAKCYCMMYFMNLYKQLQTTRC